MAKLMGFSQRATVIVQCPKCHYHIDVHLPDFFYAISYACLLRCPHCNIDYGISLDVVERAAEQRDEAERGQSGASGIATESGLYECIACGETNCTEKNKVYFCDECSSPLSDAELADLGLPPHHDPKHCAGE